MADYFKTIFNLDPKAKKQVDTGDKETEPEDTLKADEKSSPLSRQDTIGTSKKGEKKKQAPLPKLKANVSIKDFRVAIIENVNTPQPQALTLKVILLVL